MKQGVLNDRRVDYFRGKHAVNALLRAPYKKNASRPAVASRVEAEALLTAVQAHGFFLKVTKHVGEKHLHLAEQQGFEPDAHYAWFYQGSQLKGILIGTAVLLVVLAGVMFPLWPASMRQGVYYLSLGLLGLMGVFMGLVVFRLALYLVLKATTGRDGWLYPNLFADVGVIESFTPVWGYVGLKNAVAQTLRENFADLFDLETSDGRSSGNLGLRLRRGLGAMGRAK
ncbi:Translocation protein S62 [Thoreauomyces humboldtii]|nr:Translocation protein S62 [Thoreauomyces humboldtii]